MTQLRESIAVCLLLASPWVGASGQVAAAPAMKKLPTIQHIGVVPVQWRDAEVRGTPPTYVSYTESEFSSAVRESHRFRVIDDELVRTLWDEPKGRSELVSQYQLQAFATLNMAVEPDTVRATVRLTSPQLETFIQESETFGAQSFQAMSKDAIGEQLRSLVFRVFNRLPVDVYVTSVQGKYVTLSGGQEQGVQVGDEVDLARIYIAARHPANGTWVKFAPRKLGKARVIDVKNFASVAEIVSLTHDGAVEVGDGAKIDAIESRAKFARAKQKENFRQSLDRGPVLVQPDGMTQKSSKSLAKKPNQVAAPAPTPSATQVPANSPEESQPMVEANQFPIEPERAEEGPVHQEPAAAGGKGLFGFSRERYYGGPNLWKASGDASASAKFPFWLVSYAGIDLDRRPMEKDVWLAAGGSLGLGQTGGGSFLGYGFNGRGYFEGSIDRSTSAVLSAWRVGGGMFFDGMRVNGESFGGMDIIRIGALGGVKGKAPIDDLGLNWDAELRLYPIMSGRVGTNGTLSGVKSAMGWDLLATGVLDEKSSPKWGGYLWGGGFGFGSQALKGADEGATLSSFKLLLVLQK